MSRAGEWTDRINSVQSAGVHRACKIIILTHIFPYSFNDNQGSARGCLALRHGTRIRLSPRFSF